VYAVGQYGDSHFLLKMAMSVNAQKMSDALVEALAPRCRESKNRCGETDVEDFRNLLLTGLPNGAPKGTELLFGTARNKLTVSINNKQVGSAINSKGLAAAFANIYTDKNAVCKLKPVNLSDGDDGDRAQQEESTVSFTPAVIYTTAAVLALSTAVLFGFYSRKKTN
jgi:hypothetical protein